MKKQSKSGLIKSNRELKNTLELLLVHAKDGNLDFIFNLTKSDYTVTKNSDGTFSTERKESMMNLDDMNKIIEKQRHDIMEDLYVIKERLHNYNRLLEEKTPKDEVIPDRLTRDVSKIVEKIKTNEHNSEKESQTSLQKYKIYESERITREEQKRLEEKRLRKIKEDDDAILLHSLSMNRIPDIIIRLAQKRDNPVWKSEYEFYRRNFPDHPAWKIGVPA